MLAGAEIGILWRTSTHAGKEITPILLTSPFILFPPSLTSELSVQCGVC